MVTTGSSKRKLFMIVALTAVVGVGAYGFGRVYPAHGPVEGTMAPAQRYVAPQVGERDVTLGDTSVAQRMQTDAFEAMVKDRNFRALAQDPKFRALAQDPNFARVMKNPSLVAKAISGAEANVAAQGIRLPNGTGAFGHGVHSLFGSDKVTSLELPRRG